MVFWNVRSLYNKFDIIKYEILKFQPDIINFSETWLHDNIIDNEINMSNFNLVRFDRGRNQDGTIRRGGGICTYVKQGIIFEEYNASSCLNDNIEMSVIRLKIPFTRDIYVFNLYRPPNGDVDEFINTLQNAILDIRRNKNNEIYFGGDMNIDMLRPNSINSRKLAKFIKLNQLKQLINTITRPDSNTCLDLILTDSDIIKEQGAYSINVSDHLPIFCIRKKCKLHKTKTNFQGRSYKNLDEDQLANLLREYDWTGFADMGIDEEWNVMFDRIKDTIDVLCPMKDFHFSNDKPDWLTNDIIILMKERDRCLRKYAKTKLEKDKIDMRKIRNLVNTSVKKARIDYIKEKLEIHKNDPKKFWKHISNLIPNNKNKSQQNFANIQDDSNDLIGQDVLADHVNYYFSNIGLKLDEHIPKHHHHHNTFQPHTNVEILTSVNRFKSISKDDLLKEVKNIAIFKSSGLIDVPSYLLKMCFIILIEKLLVIMNKSLFIGYFPIKWRKAIIVPIPKIPIPLEIGDLRPIALTPLPGKILERFVHIQLLSHLDQYNILTEYQNGFRKKHSTIDTIFRYTTDLQINKNNKHNTISLYVDFKKAFDTVNHKLLLKKLKFYNIKDFALKWIESYLSDRTQITQIGNLRSSERVVKTGVPQGSILGPIFFICYINDIIDTCKNSKILLYADDTVMYKKISDDKRFLDMHDFQQDVNRLIKWCHVNRLSINVKKTKLVFHPHNVNVLNNVHDDIKISGEPVHYVTSYLYLGVDIDNLLTFKPYYTNMCKKITYKLSLLRRIRPMITTKAALDVTKTMFCSIIDYGNIFLSSCAENDLRDIQTLQNHALRCCYRIKNPLDIHIDDLHNNSNVKPVNIRRNRQILTCIWRNISKGVIEIAIPVRNTRMHDAPSVYLPKPNTTLFKKSVYYYGSTLWNSLPNDIRSCVDINDFKLKLYNEM